MSDDAAWVDAIEQRARWSLWETVAAGAASPAPPDQEDVLRLCVAVRRARRDAKIAMEVIAAARDVLAETRPGEPSGSPRAPRAQAYRRLADAIASYNVLLGVPF